MLEEKEQPKDNEDKKWKDKIKLSNRQKKKIYQMLGAEQFQKVVFFVEDIRYKAIEKFFPNIKNWYEAACDKNYLEVMKGSGKKKKKFLYDYQMMKLAFRKELVYRQNRNYHYNPNYPMQFIKYLEKNKRIHQIGFLKNLLFLVLLGVGFPALSSTFPIVYSTLVTVSVIGLVKDFQCINLQNYNLCRFQDERMKKRLGELEEIKKSENLIRLSNVIGPVSTIIESQIELPSISQIVQQVKTKEEKQQLISYAKWQLENLREVKEKPKQKKIGGM